MKKQINEMAKILRDANGKGYPDNYFIADAKILYRAGYRKASEVYEKIFTEIEAIIRRHDERPKYQLMLDLAELKKKYTEDGE